MFGVCLGHQNSRLVTPKEKQPGSMMGLRLPTWVMDTSIIAPVLGSELLGSEIPITLVGTGRNYTHDHARQFADNHTMQPNPN